MSEERDRSGVRALASGWLPPAVEADAFEGIRRGEEAAFQQVALPLQPTLRRLAALTVDSPIPVDAVVLRTWTVALRSLDMFRWQTPFATWIAGIAIAHGRARVVDARRSDAAPDPPRPTPPVLPRPGPDDWSDLPWSARWEAARPTLAASLAALPLAEREVVHARDVERWSPRRVCDVLALTRAGYEHLLADGRANLRDGLAALVGDPVTSPRRAAQVARTAAVARILVWSVDRGEEALDPRALAVFRRWQAASAPAWRRLLGRGAGAGVHSARCA